MKKYSWLLCFIFSICFSSVYATTTSTTAPSPQHEPQKISQHKHSKKSKHRHNHPHHKSYRHHHSHHHNVRYKKHDHIVAPTNNNTSDPINYVANSNLIEHQPRLYSYSALAVNPETGTIYVSKNANVKLPIASITKLMTAMVTLDSGDNLDSYVTISEADVDHLKNTSSRLRVGRKFTRRDLLLVALMSSENRAAHALARTSYPGGTAVFVQKMNAKAKSLGMTNTQFFDPTGLTNKNQATATDLAKLVRAAFEYPLIRKDTTTKGYDFMLNRYTSHHYINSDALVRAGKIPIGLSKTGFINEAGHCLLLYSTVNGKPIIMAFLNSTGKNGRLLDAIAVRRYVAAHD